MNNTFFGPLTRLQITTLTLNFISAKVGTSTIQNMNTGILLGKNALKYSKIIRVRFK